MLGSLALLVLGVSTMMTGCLSWHTGPMAGEPKRAAWVTVDGVRVRYTDEGKGPPVVLVHGFASSLETWAGVRKELAPHRRVIALDLKGFGWTDRPAGDYSPTAQARLVFAVLDKLGVAEPAAVVAHSWGCSVALAMATAAPQRVAKLVLLDAWVFEDQLPAFFLWARVPLVGEALFSLFYDQRPVDRMALAFFDPHVIKQPLADAVLRALQRPGTKQAALAAVRHQGFAAAQVSYPQVRQPTLILWGDSDIVAPLRFGRRLLATLPDARLIVYPRCGHFPTIEASVATRRDVARFLGIAR